MSEYTNDDTGPGPSAGETDRARPTGDPTSGWTDGAVGRARDGRELSVQERADRAQSLAQGAGVDVAGYDPDHDICTDPDTGQVVRLDGRATGSSPASSEPSGGERRDGGANAGPSQGVSPWPATGDWDAAAAIAERDGYVLVDPAAPGGFRALTAAERGALVENVSAGPPASWTAGQHEAYLDDRPDETAVYNPSAEYGDPEWREPASDAEAAARTAWLDDNTTPTPGWTLRPPTEVEDALDAAREQAVHSDWAHDHNPHAWAEYRRLEALDHLAPLPERDALDNEQHTKDHLTGDDGRGPFTDTQGRWWPSTGAWAAGTCDPTKALDTEHPDDPERLRQRIEDLRAQIAHRDDPTRETGLGAGSYDQGEQRRAQLARWHDDDHRVSGDGTEAHHDTSGDAVDGSGWGR